MATRRSPYPGYDTSDYSTDASTGATAVPRAPYQPRTDGGVVPGVPPGPVAGSPPPAPEPPPIEPPAEVPHWDPLAQVGHDGTTKAGWNREQYRDAWQGSGVTNNAGLDAWLQQNGGKRINDSGVVMTPFGEQIDMGEAFKTGNGKAAWGGVGPSSPAASQGGYTDTTKAILTGVTPGAGSGSNTGSSTGSNSGSGAGSGGSNGTSSSKKGPLNYEDLHAALAGLFPNGAFNQDVVTNRTSQAADTLARTRKSVGASNAARLAARGLIGSGPEGSAQESLDERLYNDYADQVSGIYADESSNADSRMIAALQTAAGLTASEAATAVQSFRANSDNTLGHRAADNADRRTSNDFTLGKGNLDLGYGNLALGNKNADNSFALGRGNLDLGYDTLNSNNSNSAWDRIIKIIMANNDANANANGGYVGGTK